MSGKVTFFELMTSVYMLTLGALFVKNSVECYNKLNYTVESKYDIQEEESQHDNASNKRLFRGYRICLRNW